MFVFHWQRHNLPVSFCKLGRALAFHRILPSDTLSRERRAYTACKLRPVLRATSSVGKLRTNSSSSAAHGTVPGTNVPRRRCVALIRCLASSAWGSPRRAACSASMTCGGDGLARQATAILRQRSGSRALRTLRGSRWSQDPLARPPFLPKLRNAAPLLLDSAARPLIYFPLLLPLFSKRVGILDFHGHPTCDE